MPEKKSQKTIRPIHTPATRSPKNPTQLNDFYGRHLKCPRRKVSVDLPVSARIYLAIWIEGEISENFTGTQYLLVTVEILDVL